MRTVKDYCKYLRIEQCFMEIIENNTNKNLQIFKFHPYFPVFVVG